MKKILSLLSVIFLTFGCYDDSDIRNELRDHEERLAKLETLCKQMNTNISALQTIVSTLQKNVFVTAVTPIKEGSDIVGYAISFSNSESVTIYHGRDGVDGEDGTDGADGVNGTTPSIGVRQDTDGIYYWTLDGEWLLDATGKKVQAVGRDGSDGAAGEDGSAGSDGEDGKDGMDGKDGEDGKDGADGKTPQLKIESGYWYVSYDGEKWTQLGKATGESANLIGITQDDKNVYFTLTDGTVISIPKGNGGSQDDEEGGADDGSQTISKGPITLSLGEVTYSTVTFDAYLDIDVMADYQEVGFIYSTVDEMDIDSPDITKVQINRENYSNVFTGLLFDTTYYYTVYMRKNGVYQYGKTQVFKTNGGTPPASCVLLSSSANCYIIEDVGYYAFKATKGNSAHFVVDISHSEILWESYGTSEVPSVGDLIKSVEYRDGYIAFQTADTFKEGNAVIAAKDANGNILWSWHIWLTDQPRPHVYNNNAGTMMDRNLGATSATPGDVGALGLLYQWGRKDPFLGSSSINGSTLAKSTITWPLAESTSSYVGTVDYVTSHPTTFVKASSSPYDWHYSSRDNTLWTTSDKTKSIYDPCPSGWRVPDGDSNGVWAKAIGSTTFSFNYAYDSINRGMDFFGKFSSTTTIWYPASGYRYGSDGSLGSDGLSGYYWSASPSSDSARRLDFYDSGSVYPSYSSKRANGQSVRCLQESK